MTNRKSQNSILFLTTLMLVAASICVGQSNEIQLNRRPLIDFAEAVEKRIQSGRLSVDAPFAIEFKGNLDKSGKLVPSTFKITRSEGDPHMLEIIKDAISAVNDAGYFLYLRTMDITDITVLLRQDDALITGQVSSDMINDQRANSVASAFAMLTRIAKSRKEGNQPMSERDKDDVLLLNSLSTSASGKTFTLKLELPRETIRDMIMARLSAK